jgi:hypothetical protein
MTYPLSVADWATISSLATAGGTLVLAVATFSSVRSANRSARIAEQALRINTRPLLFQSRLDDPQQKLRWGDDHRAMLQGGRAILEEEGGVAYLAASLRNVGQGIAVIQGWRLEPWLDFSDPRSRQMTRPDVELFRQQSRDLYVPAGDVSFWQAAIREGQDPDCPDVMKAIHEPLNLLIDLLYSDHEGGQRTITRFLFDVRGETWLCSVVRHWNLDRPDPR